jgi:hypothetical protein
MITTSTPALDFTEIKQKNSPEDQLPDFASPSLKTIEAILNYSKNLVIRESNLVQEIEYMKS